MALRTRRGRWHYRFKFQGHAYAETTGLAATERNRTKALAMELEHRKALEEGRRPERRVMVRQFSEAAHEFLEWATVEYREHPNSSKRLATSFASAIEFFDKEPVSLIDAGSLERYKAWRIKEHEIRDITLRHDLHALSKFFGYAIKQRWTNHNPVKDVEIPSDVEAVRMHVVSVKEEQDYFARAAKWPDLHDVGRLMLNQGMRPEEVTSLRKADVDMDHGQVHIREGKSAAARRALDLTTESKVILGRRMPGPSQWIFPSKRNPGQRIARVNGQHDKVCADARRAGIALNFVLYDLRHTWATRMAQCGTDIPTLAAMLGHNSIRIVQKYVHPTADHKKAAMVRYEESQRTEYKWMQ